MTGGVLVIRAAGEVDLLAAPRVVDCIRDALKAGNVRVALDCTGATFMDSKMIEAIFLGAKRLRDEGGELAVASAHEHVTRVMEVLGVDAVVGIHPTRDEAVASVRDSGERVGARR